MIRQAILKLRFDDIANLRSELSEISLPSETISSGASPGLERERERERESVCVCVKVPAGSGTLFGGGREVKRGEGNGDAAQ
jgi:hypothetical protein